MNEPTQTQGSAAVPANGVPAGAPIVPATAPATEGASPEQAQVSQQNPGITLDEVDAIIAKRKQKRETEQQEQKRTQQQQDFETKYKTAEQQLEAYKKAALEIRTRPVQSLRTLGFDDSHIQEMLTNMQVEGQPSHQAMTEVATLKEQLAQVTRQHTELVESLKTEKQTQMTRAQQEFAQGELTKIFGAADPKEHAAGLAYWSERPREAWDASAEFAMAYCERNQTDTCPYPEIVRYLDQKARRDAAKIVERLAPALGWARSEAAPVETSHASKDATQATAPKADKKKKVDVSKLSREERIALADAELAKAREARGQKG